MQQKQLLISRQLTGWLCSSQAGRIMSSPCEAREHAHFMMPCQVGEIYKKQWWDNNNNNELWKGNKSNLGVHVQWPWKKNDILTGLEVYRCQNKQDGSSTIAQTISFQILKTDDFLLLMIRHRVKNWLLSEVLDTTLTALGEHIEILEAYLLDSGELHCSDIPSLIQIGNLR